MVQGKSKNTKYYNIIFIGNFQHFNNKSSLSSSKLIWGIFKINEEGKCDTYYKPKLKVKGTQLT